MSIHSVRPSDDEIERIVNQYSNTLFRLCFTILCNNSDAEDAVSDTFLKFITKSSGFCEEEHEKAWLIKVATNICLDMRRFNKKHQYINFDDLSEYCKTESDNEILEEVLRLPEKYRLVIHLYYIEGYKTEEISKILSISPAAVRKRLQYGREKLKFQYDYERSLCYERR